MAGAQDGGVDPRFDPQFQRGYDPKRHRTRAGRPAVEPVETPAVAPTEVSTGSTTEVSTGSTTDAAPRFNPFRLALLLASVAAIGGSGLLMWRRVTEDQYYYGVGLDIVDTFLHQFADALLVPLLTGGLLGLCIWLALGAIRPRRHD